MSSVRHAFPDLISLSAVFRVIFMLVFVFALFSLRWRLFRSIESVFRLEPL